MKKDNKKIFPKIKKNIKSFLTDESWKITKKDALWLSVWAVLLSWAEIAFWWDDAHSSHSSAPHSSYPTHVSSACWHISQWHANWYTAWWHLSWSKASHASAIKSWHYNATPSWWHYSTWVRTTSHSNQWHVNGAKHCSNPTWGHFSHSSHWSHWSSWDR